MRYFDQDLIANSALHAGWFAEQNDLREFFMSEEIRMTANAAGPILPRDAWMDLDTVTARVMRDDEGEAFMADLMALARPMHIGALVAMTRVASDAGIVVRSLSGQTPVPMDKVQYDYRGTPVPMFLTGYGREWREWNTQQNANFDALVDDQEAHAAKLRADMADYALYGDVNISVKGYKATGILNNPLSKTVNLGAAAGGANIDLTDYTTTPDEILTFVSQYLGAILDANKVTAAVNLYVSPEIGRNLDRSYSGAQGSKDGSIWTQLLKDRRIAKLAVTSKLTGNAFFGFVAKNTTIRPLIGMAATTTAMPRIHPRANYQFEIAAAMGIEIRADYNNASGVFHSVVVD